MDTSAVAQLRDALVKLEKDPSAIHRDDMAFFRSYVEGFGGTIPPKPTVEDPAEEEGDLEPDLEGVVEPDDLPPQAMGEPGAEVSDEVLAQDAKGKAMEQLGAGNFEKAIDLFTQAIILNPGSAILHANRAGAYVKWSKPNAAIRDCNAALAINPDSARAYKSRGMALALLGKWEAAAKDLRAACSLDYDEEANTQLKFVDPKAKRISDHRLGACACPLGAEHAAGPDCALLAQPRRGPPRKRRPTRRRRAVPRRRRSTRRQRPGTPCPAWAGGCLAWAEACPTCRRWLA
mmetsp:Transcript_28242/g.89945  ORF Transcript_28242/g.89945 Transcript_28242/m.89945 type:complete len:290 (-) Transcript_28242:261-1130(-)